MLPLFYHCRSNLPAALITREDNQWSSVELPDNEAMESNDAEDDDVPSAPVHHVHHVHRSHFIAAHRVDRVARTVHFMVRYQACAGGPWLIDHVEEIRLQDKYPEMVYSYWARISRRRSTGLNRDRIFLIHAEEMRGSTHWLYVQWVGFTVEQCTWETIQTVRIIAPELLATYERYPNFSLPRAIA
ncbi:hypothetical protein ACJZ2D_008904 [Fusarium nematophilum]